MIPANYVTILGKRKGTKYADSVKPPAIVQSDSSVSLARESQFLSPSSRQMAALPENELESAFDAYSGSAVQRFSDLPKDSSSQDAADILNDVPEN